MRSTSAAAHRKSRAPSNLLKRLLCSAVAAAFALSATLAGAQFGDRATSSLDQNATPRVLPIRSAFPYHLGAVVNNKLAITWTPAPEHYLYRHRFAFSAGEHSLPFTLPDGLAMEDEFFGAIEAYFGAVITEIDLSSARDLPAASSLSIRFQGCAAWGFCYPPQTVDIPLHELFD
jgi:thiol:disulfide interchange protein DsbD